MTTTPPKTALVTGAGQGIGKATAQLLARRGYRVVLAELDAQAGREAQAELAACGEGWYVQCDVASEPSVEACVRAVLERGGRLDALVNNAGIAGAASGPVEMLSLAEWNRRIGANLTGVFLMAKHCAPHLRAARGAMVNVASTRALQSEPNTEAYSASKGGVLALSHALAISLGPQVRVNCVSPGWIDLRAWNKRGRASADPLREADHAQHPVGRVGRPEDVAELIAFLLSEAAGFITGQNYVVDGGMSRKMTYLG